MTNIAIDGDHHQHHHPLIRNTDFMNIKIRLISLMYRYEKTILMINRTENDKEKEKNKQNITFLYENFIIESDHYYGPNN